jgi:hypothetical protein
MKFTKQFFGGLLIGMAVGIVIGAEVVRQTSDADVKFFFFKFTLPAMILAVVGVALARPASSKP